MTIVIVILECPA